MSERVKQQAKENRIKNPATAMSRGGVQLWWLKLDVVEIGRKNRN
jgi:hypothetical protein